MRTGVRVALALLLASAAAPVLACSCVFPPGARSDHVRREYRDASAVFSAYVHGIHMAEIEGQPVRVARLRVLQVWKGDGVAADSWMDVVADDDTGLVGCGYSAEQDQTLMVYARGRRPPYWLMACSLTGPLDQATGDIPLLNRLSGRRRAP